MTSTRSLLRKRVQADPADPAAHLLVVAAVGDHLQAAADTAAVGDAAFSAVRSTVEASCSTVKVATCRKLAMRRCGTANAPAVSAGWTVATRSSSIAKTRTVKI